MTQQGVALCRAPVETIVNGPPEMRPVVFNYGNSKFVGLTIFGGFCFGAFKAIFNFLIVLPLLCSLVERHAISQYSGFTFEVYNRVVGVTFTIVHQVEGCNWGIFGCCGVFTYLFSSACNGVRSNARVYGLYRTIFVNRFFNDEHWTIYGNVK